MRIEFNPNRVGKPDVAPPAGSQEPVRQTEEVPFQNTDALEERLRNIPDVRPETVDHARLLLANVKYPPLEMLDRIANLLAIRMN